MYKHPIIAILASLAFIASTALPDIPPDTCDLRVCAGLLPGGGYSYDCSGYCINATCLTKVEIVGGDTVYSCYCRESSDSDAFTDRETNTACRGKVSVTPAGGRIIDCEKVLCKLTCFKQIALPTPGNCKQICTCPSGI